MRPALKFVLPNDGVFVDVILGIQRLWGRGRGITTQNMKSRVRFPMGSLEFFESPTPSVRI